jgi:hypothetical protein
MDKEKDTETWEHDCATEIQSVLGLYHKVMSNACRQTTAGHLKHSAEELPHCLRGCGDAAYDDWRVE